MALLASLPAVLPGGPAPAVVAPSAQQQRWSVTHACEEVAGVLPLAEAQSGAGMRPAVLTPNGWLSPGASVANAPPLSLVHAWRKVRHWKTIYAREAVGQTNEIVHAHCFSAAMAAIRSGCTLVYDVACPIGLVSPRPGPWLQRSLSVAENFVLARAAAVVVHSRQMWNWALEHGVGADHAFLVPQPVSAPPEAPDSSAWLLETAGTRPRITAFAPHEFTANQRSLDLLLRAFATLTGEIEGVHLLIETADPSAFADCSDVHFIRPEDRDRALAAADLVLAGAAADGPNQSAIDAFAFARALLAADVPANREVSPQGRGCLWFDAASHTDLAHRAAFLARNPDFRAALGRTGHAHLEATRGYPAVARAYGEVYRHALDRGHAGGPPDLFLTIPALAVC